MRIVLGIVVLIAAIITINGQIFKIRDLNQTNGSLTAQLDDSQNRLATTELACAVMEYRAAHRHLPKFICQTQDTTSEIALNDPAFAEFLQRWPNVGLGYGPSYEPTHETPYHRGSGFDIFEEFDGNGRYTLTYKLVGY